MLAFGDLCQANLMYYMARAFYVNMSWAQNTILNGLSNFINPETRLKMMTTDKNTMPELLELFHPGQLEKRFGGNVDTPKNFWPPYVGKIFIPEATEMPLKFMDDQEY